MSGRIDQFWAAFESQYLWNASSKWAEFLDLHKQHKTQ